MSEKERKIMAGKILVAVFSASGVTKRVGEEIARIVGFPIWWGVAPRIIDTFLESYEFSGKNIIPFCTSGGSGIGRSGPNMEALAGTGTWLEGKRFSGNVSEADLQSWIDGLK